MCFDFSTTALISSFCFRPNCGIGNAFKRYAIFSGYMFGSHFLLFYTSKKVSIMFTQLEKLVPTLVGFIRCDKDVLVSNKIDV